MEAEVARFFRDLRAALQMSQAQAAQRLATRMDIIAALEAGDVSALPPWPECCRIVRTYTAPVGLDPRPILHSLEALLAIAARKPKPARSNPAANPAIAAVSANVGRLLRGRNGRALFAVAVPVGLLVLLTQTSVLEAAVAQLPPSVVRIVRGAQDYVTLQLAPVRDGLRWIDVRDPRSRRSDKLRTAVQSD
jgi:cytoskeletal protein RodZ